MTLQDISRNQAWLYLAEVLHSPEEKEAQSPRLYKYHSKLLMYYINTLYEKNWAELGQLSTYIVIYKKWQGIYVMPTCYTYCCNILGEIFSQLKFPIGFPIGETPFMFQRFDIFCTLSYLVIKACQMLCLERETEKNYFFLTWWGWRNTYYLSRRKFSVIVLCHFIFWYHIRGITTKLKSCRLKWRGERLVGTSNIASVMLWIRTSQLDPLWYSSKKCTYRFGNRALLGKSWVAYTGIKYTLFLIWCSQDDLGKRRILLKVFDLSHLL